MGHKFSAEYLRNEIIVIGSSNTDMMIKTKRLPRQGETLLGGAFTMSGGGKGANQAVAAARLGGTVSLIAKVGDDSFGREAMENFTKDGIDTTFITVDTNYPSGAAIIFVDNKGENSIAVAPGANAALLPADIDAAIKRFDRTGIALLQLEIPMETVVHTVEICREKKIRVILNPAPSMELNDELLANVDILTPNQSEITQLLGINIHDSEGADHAAEFLLEKGVGTVIITMGSKGAFIKNDKLSKMVPGFEVNAIDTTGAGDVFNGALAVALSKKLELVDAVVFANAAAALTVQKTGARNSIPSMEEVLMFLEKDNQDSY